MRTEASFVVTRRRSAPPTHTRQKRRQSDEIAVFDEASRERNFGAENAGNAAYDAAMAAKKLPTDALLKELREFGLRYPGAHLKSPWPGHLDLAVKDKTFAYLSIEGEPFGISCKLPHSNSIALMLPFTEPTGYGLGKSGWVSAKFPPKKKPPRDLLKAWIDESYRAQAPKKLVASLAGERDTPLKTQSKPKARKKPVRKRR
jgi:predicted DNA-binding protein (MmcQ/YjbR family)